MKNYAHSGRHTILLAVMMMTGALLLTGCGDSRSQYFEYDNDADEISGKINLNRITYIVPRLKVGVDEGRLNEENIEKLIRKIKEKEYTSFRVKAYIIFDEHSVTMYESELFEKGKNQPDGREIREMKKQLTQALNFYRSI
jgi:hypothetical protein